MRKIVFRVLSTISLLIAATVAAIIIRSIWRGDEFHRQMLYAGGHGWDSVASYSGMLRYERFRSDWIDSEMAADMRSQPQMYAWRHMRFAAADGASTLGRAPSSWPTWLTLSVHIGNTNAANSEPSLVEVPYLLPLTVFSVPPLVWELKQWRRRRRSSRHLCTNCGYDLRATTDRCPECGQAVAA